MTQNFTILVVEDQKEWQKKFQKLLSVESYTIKIADTLQQASDLIKTHKYDVVILDLRLKDWEEGNFDGWKLMELLVSSREKNGTQVIISSAYGQTEHVREGFRKYGIADYIDKKRLIPNDFRKSVSDAIAKAMIARQS